MSTSSVSSAAVHVITGNLGNDPLQCATRSGIPMVIFSVAVNRRYGGKLEASWYRIKTFGALAEACLEHLNKGRLIQAVVERMSAWAYIDARSGKPRAAPELIATNVTFLDPPTQPVSVTPVRSSGDIHVPERVRGAPEYVPEQ